MYMYTLSLARSVKVINSNFISRKGGRHTPPWAEAKIDYIHGVLIASRVDLSSNHASQSIKAVRLGVASRTRINT